MNKNLLTMSVVLGVVYIVYSLTGTIFGRKKNEPHIFELAKLEYVAKWFHSKEVDKVISTKSLTKSMGPFEDYDIEIHKEEISNEPDVEITPTSEEPPLRPQEMFLEEHLIDLKQIFASAKNVNAKGIFIDGSFKAGDENLILMKNFIEQNGFIYIGSPNQFVSLSNSFIEFLQISIKSGSISVMYFEKMVTQSGSSLLENLEFLKEYKKSENNSNLLIEKLKIRLNNELQMKEEMKPKY